jgi:arabinosyltransferase A/arabinosyltransferase B/arabinosyltransferase C
VGLGGVTVAGALVLAGQNLWPFVYGWYSPTFSTLPPQVTLPVGEVELATIFIAAGSVVTAIPVARRVWWRSAERPGNAPGVGSPPGVGCVDERRPLGERKRDIRGAPRTDARGISHGLAGAGGGPRPVPATPLALVLVGVLALQVLSLGRIAAAHPDGYTPTGDAIATAAGDPCGLQSALLVETNPGAGTLALAPPATSNRPLVPDPAPTPLRPATLDAGGTAVPAVAVTDPGVTPWYSLDARQRAGELPVVVTVAGWTGPAPELAVEFARGRQVVAHVPLAGSVVPADRRVLAPPDADTVRLAVTAGPTGPATLSDGTALPDTAGPDAPLASLPRAPTLTPMTQLLPRGTQAVLDWPVAFVFPCLTPEPFPPGTAGIARWRVGPPSDDPSADITYTPGLGGPFATARLLVTQHRMPTYVRGDPTREGPQLYRWDPLVPMGVPTPIVRLRTVVSPVAVTHLRVPRLVPE